MADIAYASTIEEVDVIPTGLFIDKLTGVDGIPRGYITEIFGDEGIGKSSLALQIVASAQKAGLRCLWADVEWSYSPMYAKALGVDNATLGIIQTEVAEDVLNTIEEAATSGDWDLIVLDSVGGILPRNEAEKDADGKTIGSQAGLMARFSRKIVPQLRMHNVALLAINHAFVDIMSGKIKTSGGKKFAYHKSLSIRLKAKNGLTVKQGDKKVGKIVTGEVKKNKHAATEGLELDGQLIFGTGFSASADLLNDALDQNIITKQGNTYYFNGEKLGIGLSKIRTLLEQDEALTLKVKEAIK